MSIKEQASQNTGGVSFLGLLTIVFIVLKLCHVIDWSWFWVLSPIIIPTFIVVLILAITIIIGIIKIYSTKNKRGH